MGEILLLNNLTEEPNNIYIGHTSEDARMEMQGHFGDLFASFQKGAPAYCALLETFYHLFLSSDSNLISDCITVKWHKALEWDK